MAGLIACPDCGESVSPTAVACPKCGRPIARRRSYVRRLELIGFLVVLISFATLLVAPIAFIPVFFVGLVIFIVGRFF